MTCVLNKMIFSVTVLVTNNMLRKERMLVWATVAVFRNINMRDLILLLGQT